MSELRSYRAFPVDLEVRADGRTIAGIAAPFDTPTNIVDFAGQYIETIRRGAFARTIAERGPTKVKLNVQHDVQSLPIGRATLLREDAQGLYAEFRVSQTDRGNEALTLVRDGTLDGLSIGFRAIRSDWSADHASRTLLEVALDEVSVVTHAAYEDARILAVRSVTSPLLQTAQMRLQLLQRGPF